MAVKRFSTSLISDSGQDKSSNFIANYSPAIDEMELIERVRVGSGGTSAIEFTEIPQTYQHLQVRYLFRSAGTNAESAFFHLNGDTGSTYAYHHLRGNGASVSAYGAANEYPDTPNFPVSTSTSNVFGAGVIDILDYTSTNKNKTVRCFGGYDTNGGGYISIVSHLRINTSAVTTITITPRNANNFAEYSTASLYGVKL